MYKTSSWSTTIIKVFYYGCAYRIYVAYIFLYIWKTILIKYNATLIGHFSPVKHLNINCWGPGAVGTSTILNMHKYAICIPNAFLSFFKDSHCDGSCWLNVWGLSYKDSTMNLSNLHHITIKHDCASLLLALSSFYYKLLEENQPMRGKQLIWLQVTCLLCGNCSHFVPKADLTKEHLTQLCAWCQTVQRENEHISPGQTIYIHTAPIHFNFKNTLFLWKQIHLIDFWRLKTAELLCIKIMYVIYF